MAKDDLAEIVDYFIGLYEYDAAESFLNHMHEAVTSLRQLPFRGHALPELETFPDKSIRELHVDTYRLIYRITGDEVFIMFVVHGARDIINELLRRAFRFT